ncbi:MAG: RecX family transcriptional regulator [Clostridiales bacterium]|nr:RecX family transcriptional regulator [Clostridiales bacterium]
MKITKIEIQKKNKNRYSLYMDDVFKCGVHEDVIVYLGLHVNQEISDEMYNDILLKEVVAKAKADAIKFISYRMRSVFDVKEKLKTLECGPDVISQVLDFLEEHNLVNDFEFTKAFIHDKSSISRHSMSKISYELKKKGISSDIINKAKTYYSELGEDFDYENAKVLSLKKYKQLVVKNKYNEYEIRQKVYQYLSQKGFNIYLVKEALEDGLYEESLEEPIE